MVFWEKPGIYYLIYYHFFFLNWCGDHRGSRVVELWSIIQMKCDVRDHGDQSQNGCFASTRLAPVPLWAQGHSEHHHSHIAYRAAQSINQSLRPRLPTDINWLPIFACQSQESLICWNKSVLCVKPLQMFIKLFSNESRGINSCPQWFMPAYLGVCVCVCVEHTAYRKHDGTGINHIPRL